jgi:integrase
VVLPSFFINTGMRKTELLTLSRDQIRGGLVHLTHMKSDQRREIPVNEYLAEMFKRIRPREGLTSEQVLTYDGTRIDKHSIYALIRFFRTSRNF